MTRRALLLRLCTFAALLFGLMAVSNPTTASAQIKCVCDAIVVYPADNIPCSFALCIQDPLGNINCETIKPGNPIKIKCVNGGTVSIKDCNGNLVTINEGCTYNIAVGVGCCIDVCLAYDENKCIVIKVAQSARKCKCL